MKRLLCWLYGHRWARVLRGWEYISPNGRREPLQYRACARCGAMEDWL